MAAKVSTCSLLLSKTSAVLSSSARASRFVSRAVSRCVLMSPSRRRRTRAIWQSALGSAAEQLNGELESVLAHFDLDMRGIHAVCAELAVRERTPESGTIGIFAALTAGPRLEPSRNGSSRSPSGQTSCCPRRNCGLCARLRCRCASVGGFTMRGDLPRKARAALASAHCLLAQAVREKRWLPKSSPTICGSIFTALILARW